MATLKISGLEELDAALGRLANIPESLKEDMLKAMASVAAAKIRSTGESMGVRDSASDEHILDRIKIQRPKLTESGGYADVTFSGSRTRGKTRTRNAEIAFINEYGKRSQDARPFIGTAMMRYEEQITEPGAKKFWDWLEKTFES